MPRSRVLIAVAALIPLSALADRDCDYSREIDLQVSTQAASAIELDTAAGKETVHGMDGTDQARVTGLACASSEELLARIEVTARMQGDTLVIESDLPQYKSGGFWNRNYAYADLDASLPSHLPLSHRDSSGSVRINGMQGGLNIDDSSGSLTVENTGGPLSLRDSSGSITIHHHNGTIDIVEDSSGSIKIEDAQGSVNIHEDSSGSITVNEVSGDVWIGRDSSGSINVSDVAGNFTVERDGSGSINHKRVAGSVSTPKR